MTDVYSYEYKKNSSKVGTFFTGLGVTAAVMVSQIGLVIFIMIITMIKTAVTAPNGDAFDAALKEIFEGSDFAAKASFWITILSLAVILIIYHHNYVTGEQRRGTFESVIPKLKDKKRIAFIFCITISALCLTTFLSLFILNLFPEKNESLTEAFEDLKMSGALYYLDVVLLGPIFEELLTRGLIMKISKKSFGMLGCIIINALMFSLLHGNIIQSFYVLPIGAVYAFLAFQFNSVIPSIFCHMFHNLIASLPSPGGPVGYIIYAVVMIGFGYLAYRLGKDQFPMFTEWKDMPVQPRAIPYAGSQARTYGNTTVVQTVSSFQKPTTDPSDDFSFFRNEVGRPAPQPVVSKPAQPSNTLSSVWKVNLIYRQKIDSVMKKTKYTEKLFSSKELAEKWLAGKGFVYGQNSYFKPMPEPYWFHRNDTRTDHVTVKIYEIKIDEGIKGDADNWLLELNKRTVS